MAKIDFKLRGLQAKPTAIKNAAIGKASVAMLNGTTLFGKSEARLSNKQTTFEQIRSEVQRAIAADPRFAVPVTTGVVGVPQPYPTWLRDLMVDDEDPGVLYAIVSKNEALSKVPVTFDEEGNATLGEAVEVSLAYESKDEDDEDFENRAKAGEKVSNAKPAPAKEENKPEPAREPDIYDRAAEYLSNSRALPKNLELELRMQIASDFGTESK